MRIGIIGSGIAGLTAAIMASEQGDEVTLFTKSKSIKSSSSSWAQGGIVFQSSSQDKLLKHDIMKAADGMAYEKHVDLFVQNAPAKLKEILIDKISVPFSKRKIGSLEKYDLTGEAAHSNRRILYSKDNTGEVIVDSLIKYLKEWTNVKVLTNHMLIDLINIPHHSNNPLLVYEPIRCVGAYFLSTKTNLINKLFFKKIILATGGIGQIYSQTTNPLIATGDGIAAAYRIGARIVNMEFTQFHPTSLVAKKSNNFLISEAMRGEGAVLINEHGDEFMTDYHPDGSLAPRDVVARAIIAEQQKTDGEVYLSLKKTKFDFKKRFPGIYHKCKEKNINYLKLGIPVTPAFHFSCGGILTDEHGETSIKNLFAIGENACTGIHGANRLASTSLLEGFYFATQAVKAKINHYHQFNQNLINDWKKEDQLHKVDPVIVRKEFQQLKLIMWNYVGIIRKPIYLKTAIQELNFLFSKVDELYRNSKLNQKMVELRNSIQVGLIVANSAIKNKQSAGCHFLEK